MPSDIQKLSVEFVAQLRSIYLIHQNHHWTSDGANFYGKHLLFERLYKSAQEDADAAAEKIVGLFGNKFIDLQAQANVISDMLKKHASGDVIEESCKVELNFIEFANSFYDVLKTEGKLSLGMDDLIMSICNNRESAVYLLKQHGEGMGTKLSNLANKFKVKLAQMADSTQLNNSILNALKVHLANKNWGEMHLSNFTLTPKEGHMVLTCDIQIPADSPPFKDKLKYPNGLNQFKEEIMNVVSEVADKQNSNEDLVQIIKVNGQ